MYVSKKNLRNYFRRSKFELEVKWENRSEKDLKSDYSFEWKRVSLVVRQKILYCINEMNSKAKYNGSADDYLESCDLVLKRIEMFTEAPFTLQRLCELVLMPDKYYNDTNKYIHALLKCLLVVSGWFKNHDKGGGLFLDKFLTMESSYLIFWKKKMAHYCWSKFEL